MDPQEHYVRLGRLIEEAPDLVGCGVDAGVMAWVGRAAALVSAGNNIVDGANFETAKAEWNRFYSLGMRDFRRTNAASTMMASVYAALAKAEMKAPAQAQGAFIPAGSTFDAMAAVARVLGPATSDVTIIDPYMDEKALTDFAVLAPAGVPIRLLADQQHQKPSLQPAAARWTAQYGTARPLSLRLAPARTLHDRLIIVDRSEAWVLTQSLNAFAARAPASIVKTDAETAALKVVAYDAIWTAATVVV